MTYGRHPSSPDQLIWAAARAVGEQTCRACGVVVSDPEWATICKLAGNTRLQGQGVPDLRHVRAPAGGKPVCSDLAAEDDERRRSARPPIGLRLVGSR